MITIESSWGTIITDDEGNVLELNVLKEYNGETCYLIDAVKFDIREWDIWYENKYKEPSPKPSEFDVLSLGFWNKYGLYNEAEKSWRGEHN